tara:strand:+ start:88 stop:459 length:372 start_codon:yes stop_codon:yes gene_type:complete
MVSQRVDRMMMQVGDQYHVWHLEPLWEATRDAPVIDVEIESLKHVDTVCWFDDRNPATLRNVVAHFQRMERTDTAYPILLDPDGQLFDGAHRVAKALAHGQSTIKAVQLQEVPPPDEIVEVGE